MQHLDYKIHSLEKLIYVNSNVSLYWYLLLSHKTILKNSGEKNGHITEN